MRPSCTRPTRRLGGQERRLTNREAWEHERRKPPAALLIDEAHPGLLGDVARAVSTAKCIAGENAMKNCRACIQVHGGMGYTWEVPAHYYLKRTWTIESVFGTREEHNERVAERVAAAL